MEFSRVRPSLSVLLPIALFGLGCTGLVTGPEQTGPPENPYIDEVPPGTAAPLEPSEVGLRRLTRHEITTVVGDVLGVDASGMTQLLPVDSNTPFDNDYAAQAPSPALVEGLRTFAHEAALLATSGERSPEIAFGCTPTGPADDDCLTAFANRTLRLLFRRDVTADEVLEFTSLADDAGDGASFNLKASMVLEAALQDPEFLYRVELGETVTGRDDLRQLNGFEIASRLSLLLWGSAPDVMLLDRARDGLLQSSETRTEEARRMLLDPKAVRQIQRFHALWLGYDRMTQEPILAQSMQTEAGALVERVVFTDKAPWTDLFRLQETYINAQLGEVYGMDTGSRTEFGWQAHTDPRRRGILATGAVLSNGRKFGDTSPVQRGLFIRRRLLCEEIPNPVGMMVDVDEVPDAGPDACKPEDYAVHAQGACAGCHSLMDPVGFGLEQFDGDGRFRETEPGSPDCRIAGEGNLAPVGEFNGPAELSDRLLESGALERCAVTHLQRFLVGRRETEADEAGIEQFTQQFVEGGERFDELLLLVVRDPSFGFRTLDQE